MTRLTTSASAAAPRPLTAASFHLRSPPGRAKSQSAAVAITITGMLAFSTPLKNEPTQWW